MAVALFSNKKPAFAEVIVDASIREEHAIVNDITENPIEDGASVTDHIETQPRVITMEVGVSTHTDTSLPSFSTIRHIEIYRRLQQKAKSKEVFTLVTSVERYSNVVFQSVRISRTIETTNALVILCVLRQIETSLVDDAANLAALAADAALGEESLGSQGTVPL